MDRVVILTVKEPYASYLVDGLKTWELRKRPIKYRGEVIIVTGGMAIGKLQITDVLGPFDLSELANYHDRHLADPKFLREYAAGQRLFAWVVSYPVRFQRARGVEIVERFEGPLRIGFLR